MKIEKKDSPWAYLWYALYAFAGLGLEMVLLGVIEPVLWGSAGEYGTVQRVVHWSLTSVCWAAVILLLIRGARRELEFDVRNCHKVPLGSILLSLVLVAACIWLNAYDWGTLKIVGEFTRKKGIEFLFQYLYYGFEMGLVFLIVAFGQRFGEGLLHRQSNIPFGGMVLCSTWGAVHILSKGSVATGLGVMAFAIVYGILYVVLNRNTKLTYLAMLLAFII